MAILKLGVGLTRLLLWLALLLAIAWGAAALWIDGPSPRWLAGLPQEEGRGQHASVHGVRR